MSPQQLEFKLCHLRLSHPSLGKGEGKESRWAKMQSKGEIEEENKEERARSAVVVSSAVKGKSVSVN